MSTAARKARKRTRRTLLDAGMTGVAETYRFQHPRKAGTPGRHDEPVTIKPGAMRRAIEYLLGRRKQPAPVAPGGTS